MPRRGHRLSPGARALHPGCPDRSHGGNQRPPRSDRENFRSCFPVSNRTGGEIVITTAELRPVDGLMLSPEHRAALRPGEAATDENGNVHHFPRFFFEVPSWEEAHSLRVAAHFALSALISVDSREAELLLRTFPHYVPCAILALARYLEDLRREVDAPVFVSANGGYRSPAHRSNKTPCLHSWGTAADI